MSQLVELSSLDLRDEGYRLRDDAREGRVMVSVAERGIEHPLEGVDTPAARLLLNGFKRVRSARKLGLDSVPYVSLGEEEAMGILSLMRASTDKALNVLEEARFIGELLTVHGLNVPEIGAKPALHAVRTGMAALRGHPWFQPDQAYLSAVAETCGD